MMSWEIQDFTFILQLNALYIKKENVRNDYHIFLYTLNSVILYYYFLVYVVYTVIYTDIYPYFSYML